MLSRWPSTDVYPSFRARTTQSLGGGSMAALRHPVRHVTQYQMFRAPAVALNRPPVPILGSLSAPQNVEVMQFDTSRMAASRKATPTVPKALDNVTTISQPATAQIPQSVRNHSTSVNASATDVPQPLQAAPPVTGVQQRTFAGGAKCGITVKDGQLCIKGPARDLLKFKNMLCFRENVTFIEEEFNSGRLIAFDFDKTMAEIFLWAELGGLQGADVQVRNLQRWYHVGWLLSAFGGQERVTNIRKVLEACRQRGDLLCILSSGFAEVIRPALRMMNLDDLIPDELVYGSDTWPFGISKSGRLAHLKRQHNRPLATLIDDDLGYCKAAVRDGHDVIWVKAGNGAQKRELDALLHREWDKMEALTYL